MDLVYLLPIPGDEFIFEEHSSALPGELPTESFKELRQEPLASAMRRNLEQIYEGNYLETGEQATDAILCAVAIVPSLRVEIASLQAECDGAQTATKA